jgi:long-subunit fatty acid transport protein
VAGGAAGLALLLAVAGPAAAQVGDSDRIDITGRQNLTFGSGARAYGMGGAFLARADDATAASWNPAGLSYLRLPEVSLVGAFNSFDVTEGSNADHFAGNAIDFAAFTWPVRLGDVRGAVQLSYQRAISFDGSRRIDEPDNGQFEEGSSDGGFDVVAFGTGLRVSRRVRAGFTVNRWLNGYDQTLDRTILRENNRGRPLRSFELDFRPRGWSFNLGLMVSPVEELNLAAVYKTPFTADVRLEKTRWDRWGTVETLEEVTRNTASSEEVRLDFPSSLGFGISWRPRDTLTLSADYTRTTWSEARIRDYFELTFTLRDAADGTPAVPPPPIVFEELQYPTLRTVPDPADPDDPARLFSQRDAEQLRVGVEWVLIKGSLKVPLRAGYFNDRWFIPNPGGNTPRFHGLTVGTGLILGSLLLDAAYIHEFGEYLVVPEAGSIAASDGQAPTVRNSLTANRIFASIIYRFRGRP